MTQSVFLRSNRDGVIPITQMVQGDTGRVLSCILLDMVVEDGWTFTLWAERPDGSVYSKNGEYVSSTQCNIEFSEAGGFLTQAGTVKAQLVITDDNSDVVSTFAFNIIVQESVGGVATTEDISWRDQLAADLVPKTRKINGHALSADVNLDAEDVGALGDDVTHLSGDVPVTRKVNNKELSSDITIEADEVPYDNTSSGLSATDMQGAIDEVIETKLNNYDLFVANSHNSLFRFKDITSYFNDGTLYNRITGTGYPHAFYDIYAGDYFNMGRAVTCKDSYESTIGSSWVTIVGCNSLYGNGSSGLTRNHIVCVPGQGLGGIQHFGRHAMNDSHTTVGAYKGSKMFTDVLGAVTSTGSVSTGATINEQLFYIFGNHLLTLSELISNAMTSTLYNRFGNAGGASSGWEWANVQSCLMSEVEVYGATVWSSSGYDTGTAKNQFPLFANFTGAINNRSAYYWLKDVASASFFCRSGDFGRAGCDGAGYADLYVRPRFAIG